MCDPNDDRSNSLNPNNDACHESNDNRANQLNPNNDEFKGEQEHDNEE